MNDSATRDTSLREMLRRRRGEMEQVFHGRIRDERAGRPVEGRDTLENSEADTQGAIAFALLQMEAETLVHIEAALVRLDAGQYGSCIECESDISERRLQALPFAVRCRACEERREEEREDARAFASRGGDVPVFVGAIRF